MKNGLLILAFLATACLGVNAQERQTSYARSGLNVTLDLNWNANNYGTVQWQQSTDNGNTWTNVNNATSHTYTFKLNNSAMYRALVTGDPSCPAIALEREIKSVNFTTTIVSSSFNSIDMEVTDANFNGAEIVEYGYASALGAMGRSFDMMPLVKVGEKLPEGDFTMECKGLRPNSNYSVRFYVKTADGSVIYGPGKVANTIPGLEFSSEDWLIERSRLQARFQVSGNATVKDVQCEYGTSLDNMKKISVTDDGNGKYHTLAMSSLKYATDYFIRVTATVDGEEQTIVKTARTLTDYSAYTVDNTVQPVAHRIDWGTSRKLIKVSPETMKAVEYPRVCRLDENTLMLTYHGGTGSDYWQNSYYRMSYDNGKTWEAQIMLFDKSKTIEGGGFYRICNPQATVLDNGWVIVSASGNGAPETNENCKVLCTISKDGCKTWSDPVVVGRGRNWEPHVVQLPGGELELFVSSEKEWWGGPGTGANDQEIVYARSTDYGQTWTSLKRASYLGGGRDGMPVPVVMQGNKGVIFTIESPTAGGISPSIVHRSLTGAWESTGWDRKEDDSRWASGLNGGSGAPYCVQLPTGEIVVSAHTNQVGSVWQTCRPQVGICDNTGHNMQYKTLPSTTGNPLKSNEGAYYNSLFVKDAETIWLLTTRATYDGNTRKESSIEYVEGKIIPLK